MTGNTRSHLMIVALLGLALASACVAETDMPITGDDLPESTADGFEFTRGLHPIGCGTWGEYPSFFMEDSYVSYWFQIDEPQEIYVRAHPYVLDRLIDRLDTRRSYKTSIRLFRIDESADPDDIYARYDYITSSSSDDAPLANEILRYDAVTPGKFMVIVLGSKDCYDNELPVGVEIYGHPIDTERSPGTLDIQLLVDGTSYDATDLRVAVGTAEAISNSQGHAVLQNVEAGVSEIRFGSDGLGRSPNCSSIDVVGDGATQQLVCLLTPSEYDGWKNP